MSSDEKKRGRERFLLDRFLEQQRIRPTSIDQLRPPYPDFIINLEGRMVGVEITEIFIRSRKSNLHPQSTEGPLLQEVEAISDQIVSQAREIYFRADNPLVLSTIVFSNRITRDKKKRKQIAELIADKIRDMSLQNAPQVNWKPGGRDSGTDLLCEAIAFIHIRSVPESRFARWTVARCGCVVGLTAKHLQNRVDEKAQKINGYKKSKNLEEIWLLMAADRRRPSQMFVIPSDFHVESLSSPFAKTFYYCYATDELAVDL